MDSDESGHSESEFYYPEEETLNQMTPINLLPLVLSTASCRTISLLLKTSGTGCSYTDLPPGK